MKKVSLLALASAIMLSMAFIRPSHENRVFTVVIDAGHGGKDLGAVYETVSEKEIVANIANKIKTLNKESDIKVILTRSGDESVELLKRAEISNTAAADLLISLHVNSSDDKELSGTIFYIQPDKADKTAISLISNYISLEIGHFKASTFTTKVGDFAILKNTKVPAVLVELGYLSNTDDRNILTSESGQSKIAENILASVSKLR